MPIEILRNDITRMQVDAIVNAANESLLGGGGVDGAIHRAAGPELLAECRTLHGCKTGQAKLTRGYRLPCHYVIHTVGPVWHGGTAGEAELLASCYRNALELARQYNCKSIAFPLISAGAYGYPKEQALKIATNAITDFLLEHDMLVYIVVFDRASFHASGKLYAHIAQYIDDTYVEVNRDSLREQLRRKRARTLRTNEDFLVSAPDDGEASEAEPDFSLCGASSVCAQPKATPESLEEWLQIQDESFSQMVLRKIDEAGMKDATCYKRANLDRKLFSKIRSDVNYRPSKRTALALAVALELDIRETGELLQKAGLALSHSYKFDIIVEYFVRCGIYDINVINQALFDFDQPLLGG